MNGYSWRCTRPSEKEELTMIHLSSGTCDEVRFCNLFFNHHIGKHLITFSFQKSNVQQNRRYKGEIGFFDFYIIPLAKKLKECGVFGVSSDEYLNYATKNRGTNSNCYSSHYYLPRL